MAHGQSPDYVNLRHRAPKRHTEEEAVRHIGTQPNTLMDLTDTMGAALPPLFRQGGTRLEAVSKRRDVKVSILRPKLYCQPGRY